jgi:hypothetical protein
MNELSTKLYELAHAIKVWDGETPAANLLESAAKKLESISRFPMADGPSIDYQTANDIYKMYSAIFTGQTLEDIRRRGGFYWKEIPHIMDKYAEQVGCYKQEPLTDN